MQTVKHIFKYLKGSKGVCLTYQAEKLEFVRYSDVDFASCKDDSKSTFDYIFTFGWRAITWSYRKQEYVAQHTEEA